MKDSVSSETRFPEVGGWGRRSFEVSVGRLLQVVIEQYKTVVQASQNKAMEVCEDAFEELDAEKQKNESLTQHCQSIEELNVSLNESLQETLRLFDKSKQALLHQTMTADKDRNRYESVLDALAGSTEELDGRLRFSSLHVKTRPAQHNKRV